MADHTWYRLAAIKYVQPFYPSRGSRLTPSSLEFPCAYLAPNRETSVAEVWEDRFFAAKAGGVSFFPIPTCEAAAIEFFRLKKSPLSVAVCDLCDADTLLATGIDAGALYSTNLSIPQAWAEVLARHPAGFSGIRYRSRHTGEPCLVLWSGPEKRALDQELEFESDHPFLESAAAYRVAQLCGVKLCFVS